MLHVLLLVRGEPGVFDSSVRHVLRERACAGRLEHEPDRRATVRRLLLVILHNVPKEQEHVHALLLDDDIILRDGDSGAVDGRSRVV